MCQIDKFSIFSFYLSLFAALVCNQVLDCGGAKAKQWEFIGMQKANNQLGFKHTASSKTGFK